MAAGQRETTSGLQYWHSAVLDFLQRKGAAMGIQHSNRFYEAEISCNNLTLGCPFMCRPDHTATAAKQFVPSAGWEYVEQRGLQVSNTRQAYEVLMSIFQSEVAEGRNQRLCGVLCKEVLSKAEAVLQQQQRKRKIHVQLRELQMHRSFAESVTSLNITCSHHSRGLCIKLVQRGMRTGTVVLHSITGKSMSLQEQRLLA